MSHGLLLFKNTEKWDNYLTFSCLYMYIVLNCCISFWLGSFFMSWSISSAMCLGRMESSRRSCWTTPETVTLPIFNEHFYLLPEIDYRGTLTKFLEYFHFKQFWRSEKSKLKSLFTDMFGFNNSSHRDMKSHVSTLSVLVAFLSFVNSCVYYHTNFQSEQVRITLKFIFSYFFLQVTKYLS